MLHFYFDLISDIIAKQKQKFLNKCDYESSENVLCSFVYSIYLVKLSKVLVFFLFVFLSVYITTIIYMNTFVRQKQTIRTGTTHVYKERRKLVRKKTQ